MSVSTTMPTDREVQLQQRLLSGDRDALTEAFTVCDGRLRRMIRFRMDRRLSGRVDADDVLQEAFIDADRRLDHFHAANNQSVFLWLRLICLQTLVNVCRRHLQTERRGVDREVADWSVKTGQSTSLSIAQQFTAGLTSPSQAAVRGERSARLTAVLETMDPIDQEIIALRHFEDLSNLQVAGVLGIGPTAASNRYVRAIARLKKLLDQLPEFSVTDGAPDDD